MQTIKTKYYASKSGAGRMKAITSNGEKLIIGYPHEIKESDVHLHVAMLLADKLNWHMQFAEGTLNINEHVFVQVADSTLCSYLYLESLKS